MHEKFKRFQHVAAGAQTRFMKSQPATVNRRPSHSGNQPAGAAATFQKIVEADKKAASLDSETLAAKVRDGLAAFRPQFERWLPLVIELRSRFEALKKEKARTILGCSTWTQFCSEVLDYSDRHLRRLMGGANPAVKYRNRTKRRPKAKAFSASVVTAPSGRDADWFYKGSQGKKHLLLPWPESFLQRSPLE
jgi:hypothetical protein